MRSFVVAAVLALAGSLGLANKADAQFYLNTFSPGGGLVISAGTGFYPGLYSSYGYGYPLGLTYGLNRPYYGSYGYGSYYGSYYRPYYSGYRWGGYRGYRGWGGYRAYRGWGRRW